MCNGMIFDVARGSFVDGPGLRTTVFFKGCNLHCAWCHNPESQRMEAEKLYYRDKCIGCGRCKQVCPTPDTCTLCGRCAMLCPQNALSICGKRQTAEEVLQQILDDRDFYGEDGGVTCSGGECLLQPDFLYTLLSACKREGIHTAVDTAGCVPWETIERMLPVTDLFLYDVKLFDAEKHLQWVGADNTLILNNLMHLLQRKVPVWVRIPIIPGVNDTVEEMEKIAAFLRQNGWPQKVELLPYHRLGENKYAALGRELHRFRVPEQESMERLRAVFA